MTGIEPVHMPAPFASLWEAGPEIVRTAGCSALVRVGLAGKEHPEVGNFRCLFFADFLWASKESKAPGRERIFQTLFILLSHRTEIPS